MPSKEIVSVPFKPDAVGTNVTYAAIFDSLRKKGMRFPSILGSGRKSWTREESIFFREFFAFPSAPIFQKGRFIDGDIANMNQDYSVHNPLYLPRSEVARHLPPSEVFGPRGIALIIDPSALHTDGSRIIVEADKISIIRSFPRKDGFVDMQMLFHGTHLQADLTVGDNEIAVSRSSIQTLSPGNVAYKTLEYDKSSDFYMNCYHEIFFNYSVYVHSDSVVHAVRND